MKTALVTLARHENPYLKDWINHYRDIGIDHIIIGDNNDIFNDEDIESLVKELGYQDFVTVIPKKRGGSQQQNTDIQRDFFNEMYQKYKNDYDWFCFFDVDEYLETIPTYCENNINSYIQKNIMEFTSRYEHVPETIMVGWLHFDDNDKLFYEDKPVYERFTRVSDKIYFSHLHRNVFVGKSIVKGSVNDLVFVDMHAPICTEHELQVCFNGGIDRETFHSQSRRFIHIDAILKHYYSKSIEEFINRRFKDKASYATTGQFDNCYNDFFAVNRWSHEKQKLFELYKQLYNE